MHDDMDIDIVPPSFQYQQDQFHDDYLRLLRALHRLHRRSAAPLLLLYNITYNTKAAEMLHGGGDDDTYDNKTTLVETMRVISAAMHKAIQLERIGSKLISMCRIQPLHYLINTYDDHATRFDDTSLKDGLQWIAQKSPPYPLLYKLHIGHLLHEKVTNCLALLHERTQHLVDSHMWKPSQMVTHTDTPFQPYMCIQYFNECVKSLAASLTKVDVCEIPWPPRVSHPIHTNTHYMRSRAHTQELPPDEWNSPDALKDLRSALENLCLPEMKNDRFPSSEFLIKYVKRIVSFALTMKSHTRTQQPSLALSLYPLFVRLSRTQHTHARDLTEKTFTPHQLFAREKQQWVTIMEALIYHRLSEFNSVCIKCPYVYSCSPAEVYVHTNTLVTISVVDVDTSTRKRKRIEETLSHPRKRKREPNGDITESYQQVTPKRTHAHSTHALDADVDKLILELDSEQQKSAHLDAQLSDMLHLLQQITA